MKKSFLFLGLRIFCALLVGLVGILVVVDLIVLGVCLYSGNYDAAREFLHIHMEAGHKLSSSPSIFFGLVIHSLLLVIDGVIFYILLRFIKTIQLQGLIPSRNLSKNLRILASIFLSHYFLSIILTSFGVFFPDSRCLLAALSEHCYEVGWELFESIIPDFGSSSLVLALFLFLASELTLENVTLSEERNALKTQNDLTV